MSHYKLIKNAHPVQERKYDDSLLTSSSREGEQCGLALSLQKDHR